MVVPKIRLPNSPTSISDTETQFPRNHALPSVEREKRMALVFARTPNNFSANAGGELLNASITVLSCDRAVCLLILSVSFLNNLTR